MNLLDNKIGRADPADEIRKLEVDYTPYGVALQLVLGLLRELEAEEIYRREPILGESPSVLCPSAGSGAFVRAVRALIPAARITAFEIRESERANLEACADRVVIGDATKETAHAELYDLIVDNPPFSWFAGVHAATFLRRMLKPRGTLALLGLSGWGQSRDAWEALGRWSPSLQLRVGGRVAFRGGVQADNRDYSLWVWRLEDSTLNVPAWRVVQLPPLPTGLRRWTDPPGLHEIDAALVEQVRRL